MPEWTHNNLSIDKPNVLVHLHCFYSKEVNRYLRKLKHVDSCANFHLVATISESIDDRDGVIRQIKSFYPDTDILIVKNLGYDPAPFVEAIKAVDLSDFDYILKLHTKSRGKEFVAHLNGIMINDDVWVNTLVDNLIGSKKQFSSALRMFDNSKTGMVAAKNCIIEDRVSRRHYYINRVNQELAKMGLDPIKSVSFVAGTMFLARASLFKPLRIYSIDDFGKCYSGMNDYTLAHTFERLFGGLIKSQGYKIKGVKNNVHDKEFHLIGKYFKEMEKKEKLLSLRQRASRKFRFTYKGIEIIEKSYYFDAEWYRRNNPDIGSMSPAEHYLHIGYKEGRNPSARFDNEAYLSTHKKCREKGLNPLLHYECYGKFGKKKGIGLPNQATLIRLATIKDSPLFDEEWYVKNNPDAKQNGQDPAMHYLLSGGFNARDPSPEFCSDEYLTLHPDVRMAKTNPLYHYLVNGFIQGHELSSLEIREPTFSTETKSCHSYFGKKASVHRRTAVVATYVDDGVISETLIYMLKGLQEVVDNIILVGDCPLIPRELDRLKDIVACAHFERMGQYDFGSYKIGLRLAREYNLLDESDVDELIFMNDSCYGPVYPFKESFDYMATQTWDFWGYNSNICNRKWYVCSFFYVFNRKIIDSKIVDEFFNRVYGKVTRGIAIEQFEIQLSVVLRSQGMVGASYVTWNGVARYNHRNILHGLRNYRVPLIKKKSLSGEAVDNIHMSLEIIKRDNPELYAMIDKTQKTYTHDLPTLDDYRNALPSVVEQIRRRVQSGKAIRVLFLVNDAAMFPGRSLFDHMVEDSMFDPYVYVIPDTRTKKTTDDMMKSCFNDLRDSIPKNRLVMVHRDFYEQWPDIIEEEDIVCYPSPYNISSYNYNVRYALGRRFLPIIFNYGYYRSIYDRDLMGLYNYAYYWKVFVECEENLQEYKEYSEVHGENASLVGYGKMDRLASINRVKHERPRVLVALHHSVEGGFNDTLSLANFIRYYDYFKCLPDKYPNIDFVYRPHPQLFNALRWSKQWTQEKVDAFVAEMKAKPNVIWSDGGDYFQEFADSDACIQDCGSFLVEYFYTDKPCCYMLKKPEDIEEKFAPLGKRCLEQCYLSYNTQDIDGFIQNTVLGKEDPKAEARKILSKHIMLNYPHASEAAMKDIKDSLMS